MKVSCEQCGQRYDVEDEAGGRMGVCEICRHRFILPIGDPDALLDWATKAPWYRLHRFVRHGGAKGHSIDVVDKFIRVFEERRADEFQRHSRSKPRPISPSRSVSRQSRARADIASRFHPHRILRTLSALSPSAFEDTIVRVFEAWGYEAYPTGGKGDEGIDVEAYHRATKWAVAQCKRYKRDTRVSPAQVREFAGAYYASGARSGFFFTTSNFTRGAKRTALQYVWLTTYNGQQLTELLRNLIAERVELA